MGSIPIVASLFSPFLLTSQTCIEKWSVSFQSTGSWVILNKDISTSLSSDPLSAGLFECEAFFLVKFNQCFLVFEPPKIGWLKSNYLRYFFPCSSVTFPRSTSPFHSMSILCDLPGQNDDRQSKHELKPWSEGFFRDQNSTFFTNYFFTIQKIQYNNVVYC